ncbi:MAG: hypothetical protein AWM53_00695 [Candidatus Dichloromethanomonas elyunquensis]|nr:MAG: hypothetical protein AWM53_00695 [Candidatus Dichloromethanomonas elyunquensis]
MKSSVEMKGLKIISMNEGQQISTVKDIIINSSDGTLAFFIIDQPSDYLGARLIAFQDILGLGDYALIISHSGVIQDVAHNPLAIELIQKDIKVIGSQVLTTKGCLIGQVEEFMVEEETGRIVACQISDPQGNTHQIKCDRVITYGKEIILIDDNSSSTKHNPPERKAVSEIQAAPVSHEKELLKKKIEEFGKSDNLLKKSESGQIISYPQEFNVFEQRQLQFLLGKIMDRDVQLDNGGLLRAGDRITADSLSAVKSKNTLMQLTAHVVK